MKKVLSLVLAGALLFGIFIFAPPSSKADTDTCYDEHARCRARAYQADAGWIRTTYMLTMCDIALGVCLIANAIQE